MRATTAFRTLLDAPPTAFICEAHNALSAKIVEEVGFPGIWASGLTMSAQAGLRDNNEASWTQVLEHLEFMADAVKAPILVDGDTGHGNFNNFRRLVRKLEQRGVAAVCIEDKRFPKTNSFLHGTRQPLASIGTELLRQAKGRKGRAARRRLLDRRARRGAHCRVGARRSVAPCRGVPRRWRRRDLDPQRPQHCRRSSGL